MAHFPHHASAKTHVILLGDDDTVAHRDQLSEAAAQQACVIADAFGFSTGQAASTDDLTQVDPVVAALGRAIVERVDIWVPFLGPDLGREQHWRRLSLVLQRHGLNLRGGRELVPLPTTGCSEIDVALRREVQAVDGLDHAALASVGAEILGREIELALAGAGARVSATSPSMRRVAAGSGTEAGPRTGGFSPPLLPAPTVPWPQRQPMLKRYVRWLVHGCGVTQAATARVLNSAGQRTVRGRR